MYKALILLTLCFLAPLAAAADGCMPRPKDTGEAWKKQAEKAVEVSDIPRFTGAHLWRGRADRQYLAFHQWEFRLEGGKQASPGLRLRVLVLGPDLKVTPKGEGHWVRIGDLPAEAMTICSYKLNCGQPSAYRVQLKWRGGEESYICTDMTALPEIEAPESGPRLLVLATAFDYTKRRNAVVTFILRNDGHTAAKGVEQTIEFLDAKGKVVHTHQYVPEKGVIEPGYAKSQRIVISKCPKFKSISISSKIANEGEATFSLNPGEFTTAPTLEVAEFKVKNDKLTATVRNGTKDAIPELKMNLQLIGKDEVLLKEVPLTLKDVKPGEKRPFEAHVGKIKKNIVSWGVGFEMADTTTPAAPETLSTEAGGVVLDILEVKASADGVKLKVKVTNNTGKRIEGLLCELKLSDDEVEKDASVACGDLDAKATFEGSVIALGIKRLVGIKMSWKGGVTQE